MNHLTVQQLSAALDGALGGPSLELVVHHLAHCHQCRDRQARLARNDDALRRLLSQDPHEFFLDDLERRVESLVVAIMRGLPVPPMVTASPLQSEEDPYETLEPPLPARPELGRAGAIAHEAGFGRIGLKPAASSQAPMSDPGEARRMLEALERGAGDFTGLSAHGRGEPTSADGPVFDPPGWIKQGSGPRPGGETRPREVQRLDNFFEHLNDRIANLPHEPAEEAFRREEIERLAPPPPRAGASAPPSPWVSEPQGSSPPADPSYPPATTTPAFRATQAAAPYGPEPPGYRPPAPRPYPAPVAPIETTDLGARDPHWGTTPSWGNAGLESSPPFQPPHASPVTDAYEQVNELPRRPVPRVRPTPRFAGAWLLATATVGGLLVLVLALQFMPPADAPGATAWRGFRLPQLRFASGDSLAPLESRVVEPSLRSATTPFPVESPVPNDGVVRDGSLLDSAQVLPDSLAAGADTLGEIPGR